MGNKNYLLGLYEKAMPSDLSWEEKLLLTKESGFDYLEISIDETAEKLSRLQWDKETRINLQQLSQQISVPFGSLCLSAHRRYPLGSSNETTRVESLKILEEACILCNDLGISYLQLAGYDVYYEQSTEETRDYFIESLVKAVEIGAKYGVILAFETMETSFMDTIEKSLHYVNLINSPYLQIYPDIGNLMNASVLYNSSFSKDLALGKGHVIAAHLKETIPNHYREIPFGTGHTPFKEALSILKELGVRRFVGEFWYLEGDNYHKILKESAKFLREHLTEVFD